MKPEHFQGVIDLQILAFPPPFDRDLLWKDEHLEAHTSKFPNGQFVALSDGLVVGSCSNTLLDSSWFDRKLPWKEMVGGYSLSTFDPMGKTLYGLDISVHPEYRRLGIGRSFYDFRKGLVLESKLDRYATTCRIPDFRDSGASDVMTYCKSVTEDRRQDRTLTPLLRYGLTMTAVLENHWDDPESGNAAARLEWRQ